MACEHDNIPNTPKFVETLSTIIPRSIDEMMNEFEYHPRISGVIWEIIDRLAYKIAEMVKIPYTKFSLFYFEMDDKDDQEGVILAERIKDALIVAYVQGRSSMKKDIEEKNL